ncbi:oligosaccharide flippase family protein [Vibrio diabolicus]|uniref:oligosaccharide flippase family protein n=1 Tax=Vibrio diabolicus TaxID=50719 RepID=UPI0015931720|nr:oligosaccharide flippase family protein [Vibrio diabolicus]NVC48670.1 hypothetical protein [Vibrio diabolicus]
MKKELLKSSFFNVMSAIFSKGSAIIISIIFARTLGSESFGYFSIIQAAASTLLIFISVGSGVVITKHVALYLENGGNDKAIGFTSLNLIMSISISILIIILSVIYSTEIAKALLNNANLYYLVIFSSFIPLFSCFQVVITGYVNGKKDFKFNQNSALITGLTSIPISIYLVLEYELVGGVVSLLINQAIIASFYLCYFYKTCDSNHVNFRENIKLNYLEFKNIILKDSLPALLVGLTVTPTLLVIYQIAIEYNDSGLEIVGQFGAINQWRNLLIFIPSVLGVVFISYFSKYKEDQKYRMYNIIVPYFCVYSIIFPILLFPEIVLSVYGDSFIGSDFVISLYTVVLACLIVAVKTAIGREVVFKENYWISAISNFIWSVSFISLYFLFVNLGVLGISLSFLLSHIISLIYFLFRVSYSRVLFKEFLLNKFFIISIFFLLLFLLRFLL